MRKTYPSDSGNRPRSPPLSTARAPLVFGQSDNGACCTMALMNFLVNQTDQDPITRNLFQTAQARVEHNKHSSMVQDDDYLCSLHHFILADMTHQDSDQDTTLDLDTDNQGNHLIVILPHHGFVWELDSLDDCNKQTCLGSIGAEHWTAIAHRRLKQWDQTTRTTGATVDVQAIVRPVSLLGRGRAIVH